MTTEYQNIRGNRKHKDELFCMVFSKKEDLLDLYNAVNGTAYQNAEALEVNTLENVLYMTMKNDISFMIGCTMNLYEHQSSYNPNMPLRGLLYFAKLYSKYTEQRKLNLYSSTLQKIPTPRFIVFYNGTKEEADRQILRLSNAFQTEGGCLECEALMLNINVERNRELIEKCRRLEEYAVFIDTVRKYTANKELELGEAITLAMEECIGKEILSDILKDQRAEVFAVILETFDKELYEKGLREDIRAEVRAELMEEVKEEVRDEVKEEVRDEVKEEVRNEVKEEIRDEVLREQVCKKLAKGKSAEEISDELEEETEKIQKIISKIQNISDKNGQV